MTTFIAIPTLVREWVAWAEWADRTDKKEQDNPHAQAFDEFLWITQDHPEHAWDAILAVFAEPKAKPYLGHLAAGPVEDLLSYHGPLFIDRVEELARKDSQFSHLLDGVWQFTMAENIWARVQAARQTPARDHANDG